MKSIFEDQTREKLLSEFNSCRQLQEKFATVDDYVKAQEAFVLEEKFGKEFDGSSALQEEFGTRTAYIAFRKNELLGLARISNEVCVRLSKEEISSILQKAQA